MSKGLIFDGYDGEMGFSVAGQSLHLFITDQDGDNTTVMRWTLGESQVQELRDFLNDAFATEKTEDLKPHKDYYEQIDASDYFRRIGDFINKAAAKQ